MEPTLMLADPCYSLPALRHPAVNGARTVTYD